jgi:peptidoglycan/LPS O-acetylase OafA/YrhL
MQKLLTVFDIKAALLGSFIMSLAVAWINSGHGSDAAISSGIRQGLYTFFVAGLSAQLCRNLTNRSIQKWAAIIKAVLIPTILTVTLVYIMHSTRGTPEPFYSSIPVAILSLVSFSIIALHTLREKDNHQQADAS